MNKSLYLGNELIIDPNIKLEKVELTKAEYDALTEKKDNILYIVTDAENPLDDIENRLNSLKIPTKVSELTNDSNYTTKTEVDTRILNIIGTAPETLDTLGEIADKLSDNDDVVAVITNTLTEIQGKFPITDNSLSDSVKNKISNTYIHVTWTDTLVEDEVNEISITNSDEIAYTLDELKAICEKYHSNEITNLTVKIGQGTIVKNPIIYKGTDGTYQILINSIHTMGTVIKGFSIYDIRIYKNDFSLLYKQLNFIKE